MRIVGIAISAAIVLLMGVPGIAIASRSGASRGSFDDLALLLLAMIVIGPLIYLVGAVVWDGRFAQLVRIAGTAIWVLVGLTFARSGAGVVFLALALVVAPTLRNVDRHSDNTGSPASPGRV